MGTIREAAGDHIANAREWARKHAARLDRMDPEVYPDVTLRDGDETGVETKEA